MLSVKEVADRLQLTKHAVRYYCDQGLVPNVQRNNRNERIFDDEAILWLYHCKMLRNSGLSIKEIKHFIDLCLQGPETVDQRYNIILHEKQRLLQQIQEMKHELAFLNRKISIYKNAKISNSKRDPLNPINEQTYLLKKENPDN